MELIPGQYLKAVRERLQIGLREVQEASAIIASEEDNDNFYISAAAYANRKRDRRFPASSSSSACVRFTGSICTMFLSKFGVNANGVHSYRSRFLPETTRVTSAEVYGFEDKVLVPVRIDPSFRWETTQLINRVVALWGEIPAAFLINRNTRRHTYGYVGLTDRTMYPLLGPGSLVMIDPERTRVISEGWKTEFDRPIYFIELRRGISAARGARWRGRG